LYSYIKKQVCKKNRKGFNSPPPLELRPNTYFNKFHVRVEGSRRERGVLEIPHHISDEDWSLDLRRSREDLRKSNILSQDNKPHHCINDLNMF